jgi:hypothetical protein
MLDCMCKKIGYSFFVTIVGEYKTWYETYMRRMWSDFFVWRKSIVDRMYLKVRNEMNTTCHMPGRKSINYKIIIIIMQQLNWTISVYPI